MNAAHCARPACYGKAAAWLAYDYDARCAWLDDDASDAGPQDRRMAAHVWPLCERHADNLRVPRGWFCVDRRASRFGPAEGDPPAAVPSVAGTSAGAVPSPGTATPGGTLDNEARPGAPSTGTAAGAGAKGAPNAKGPGTKGQGKGPGTNGGSRLSSIL